MYDKHLDAFITVVELGSFSKASESLFVSANALAKQVNILERDLGIELLERTNRGVKPTEAGSLIYTSAKALIKQCNATILNAKEITKSTTMPVRLATSQLRPMNQVISIWHKIGHLYPDIQISLINFPDDEILWQKFKWDIGSAFDILLNVHPQEISEWSKLIEIRDIYTSKAFILVPFDHPFSSKAVIRWKDLTGRVLWVPTGGMAPSVDAFRQKIADLYPEITTKDFKPFDIDSLNKIAQSHELALVHDGCIDIHPAFTCIPLDDEAGFPICLIRSKNANDHVKTFFDAMSDPNLWTS